MEFSNNNPTNMTLAEIREEAYKQGRADFATEISKEMTFCYNCGMGKNKALNHLIMVCDRQMKGAEE